MIHKNNNGVVKKIAEELLKKHYDAERPYEKIYTNISFIEQLIEKCGIEDVTSAGLGFLLELEEKEQIYLLNDEHCGTPKNALNVLFTRAITETEGCEEKIAESIVDMYKKGKKSSLIIFEIFKKVATQKSTSHFQKLSKEMAKETRFSPQGDAKRKFIEKYKTEILDLINRFKPQEFPFRQPQHP